MRYFPAQYGRFPHAGCCDTSAARKETAVLDALPRAGGQRQAIPDSGAALAGAAPQPPDAAQVAAAIGRYRACQVLREFRTGLYACLAARPDALFELCDAILCADHAVTSLVQLSLVPEFRRGDGGAGAGGVRPLAAAAVRDRRHAVSPAGRRVLARPGAGPS